MLVLPTLLQGVSVMQTVFTTGQVAKICRAAPRTVTTWFDSGRLKGYRIPGSQDRRIPRDSLIAFLKEHGMPVPEELQKDAVKILCVSPDRHAFSKIFEGLPVLHAVGVFEAAIAFHSCRARCVVINFTAFGADACKLAVALKALQFPPDMIIGIGAGSHDCPACDKFVRDDFDPLMLFVDVSKFLSSPAS